MELSEIGTWSEAKLEIVRKYGKAYSTILHNQPGLRHAYIDAFAGAGAYLSKTTGGFVLGSPLNALEVKPPFEQHYFIDIDHVKVNTLRTFVGERPDVHVYDGDCNELLVDQIFPRVRYEDHWRGLCLLDPYGLHLDWKVIETAGKMGSVEIFLNFPMLDANRNALLLDPSKTDRRQVARLTRFWGDESWRGVVYRTDEVFKVEYKVRASYSALVAAFRRRLEEVAGFEYVPEPVVMRTMGSSEPILYYLFFASPNQTGAKIVGEIFDKYRSGDQGTLF
jgi:three-Cys-motif partner protein